MTTIRNMRLIVLILLMCVACGDPNPSEPSGLLQSTDDVGSSDGGVADAAGDATPEPTPAGDPRYVMINDTSSGISISDYYGTDIDAVTFSCPDDRSGSGVAVVGVRAGQALTLPDTGAIGPSDGPCDPLEDCATTTGPSGWIGVQVDSGPLSGCTITVYEVDDLNEESFEVWICPTARFDGTCDGPIFTGIDGETATGVVP